MDDGLHMRPLTTGDCDDAFTLYNALTFGPAVDDKAAFAKVIGHDGTRIFGAFKGDTLVGMLTLHILPNVTWGARPYGLVENVITAPAHRKQGIGKALMTHAVDCAWQNDAFKVMLMTGKKRGATGFYEAAGFSAEDKTAMVIRRP